MKEYVGQFNTLEKFKVSPIDIKEKKASRFANGLRQSLWDHVLSHVTMEELFEKLIEMEVRYENSQVDSREIVTPAGKSDDKIKFNKQCKGQGDKGGIDNVKKVDVVCQACGFKGYFAKEWRLTSPIENVSIVYTWSCEEGLPYTC